MNSKRKVYGVVGLMEWHANITCGKVTINVPFTGGALTGYGVTPARYTTENPLYQTIIENSEYFKSGKIILCNVYEGTGKYKEFQTSEHADAGTHLYGQPSTASGILDSTLNPNKTEKVEEGITIPETSEEASEVEEETATADGKRVVEVSDIDDARDYLVEEFSIPRSSLRSVVSVKRTAEEHNIEFTGIEFN